MRSEIRRPKTPRRRKEAPNDRKAPHTAEGSEVKQAVGIPTTFRGARAGHLILPQAKLTSARSPMAPHHTAPGALGHPRHLGWRSLIVGATTYVPVGQCARVAVA